MSPPRLPRACAGTCRVRVLKPGPSDRSALAVATSDTHGGRLRACMEVASPLASSDSAGEYLVGTSFTPTRLSEPPEGDSLMQCRPWTLTQLLYLRTGRQ